MRAHQQDIVRQPKSEHEVKTNSKQVEAVERSSGSRRTGVAQSTRLRAVNCRGSRRERERERQRPTLTLNSPTNGKSRVALASADDDADQDHYHDADADVSLAYIYYKADATYIERMLKKAG